MGRNVEIKARVKDWGALAARSEAIADSGPTVLRQEDTFFHGGRGRLKLRKFSDARGELISYNRPDSLDPAECRYYISETSRPDELCEVLSAALGVRGRLNKRRTLYLVGQTRIHLDEVDDLGRFVELEVVLEPEQSAVDGDRIARDLMKKLGISEKDLVDTAYIDLLESRR